MGLRFQPRLFPLPFNRTIRKIKETRQPRLQFRTPRKLVGSEQKPKVLQYLQAFQKHKMAHANPSGNAAIVDRNRKGKGATKSKQTQRLQVPRQHSVKAHDLRNATAFHPGQADWSIENMPDIMYVFMPPAADVVQKRAPFKTYHIHGKYLRDFPVLPDNVSSDVEEFRVEAWMRLDRRIHLSDITSRMHPEFRIHQNTLQQRGVRFRKAFSMLAWGSGNKETDNLKAKIVSEMERKGIDPELNSTRGLTPGLIHPELGEVGGRILVPRQYAQKWSSAGHKEDVSIVTPMLAGSAKPHVTEAQAVPLSSIADDFIQPEYINPAVLLINSSDTGLEPFDFRHLATVWDFPSAIPSSEPRFKTDSIPKVCVRSSSARSLSTPFYSRSLLER